MKTVRMLDLKSEFGLYDEEARAAIESVLQSQQFIGGPAVSGFEQAVCTRFRVPHAVAVSSGTDALLISLMATGIGPGDEVIVPALTFFATAGAVARVGARPVFVDIDPQSFNLDPTGIAAACSPRTRAVVPVHLFGRTAPMNAVHEAASSLGLTVIEDAAQAIGATQDDRYAGTNSRFGCLSFYPTKNLGGFGEGGMVLTGDDETAELLRRLRNQGQTQRYVHEWVGGNFRLDAIKAAVLTAKLRHLDDFTRRRRRNAALYDELLADAPVETPAPGPEGQHVYHAYSILSDRREELMSFLQERGIETAIYYPVPLHLQPCFAHLGNPRGAFPVAERVCATVLALPCHPMLSEDDIRYVAGCIREFHASAAAKPAAVQAAGKR